VASGQRLDLAGVVRPGVLQYYAGRNDIARTPTSRPTAWRHRHLGWALVVLALGICGWLIARERAAYWWLITTIVTGRLSLGTRST